MYCTHCGTPLTPGARFCAACGTPVGAASSAPAPPISPSVAPAYGPPETSAPSAAPAAAFESPAAASEPIGEPPSGATATATLAPPAPAEAATWPPIPVSPPAHAPVYAGFWRRFWALFIDRVALGVLLAPVGMLLGVNMMSIFTSGELTPDKLMTLLFGSMSIWMVRSFAEWVYFSSFHASPRQATPGQMLLGVRVVGMDGGRIGFARASGRFFASWISAGVLLIGFIMGAFTQRKQTLHDMIAGTLVVRDRVPA